MKLTAKLLTLILALSMFAGCGSDDDDDNKDFTPIINMEDTDEDDKKSEKSDDDDDNERKVTSVEVKSSKKSNDDEDEVLEVVEGYCEAAMKYDFDKALDYISEDSKLYDSIKQVADMNIYDMYIDQMSEQVSKSDAEEIFDLMFDTFDYDLDNVEIDGDEATVDVTITMIDTQEYLSKCQAYSGDDIADGVKDIIRDCGTVEQNSTVTLEKDGSEWLIISDE